MIDQEQLKTAKGAADALRTQTLVIYALVAELELAGAISPGAVAAQLRRFKSGDRELIATIDAAIHNLERNPFHPEGRRLRLDVIEGGIPSNRNSDPER